MANYGLKIVTADGTTTVDTASRDRLRWSVIGQLTLLKSQGSSKTTYFPVYEEFYSVKYQWCNYSTSRILAYSDLGTFKNLEEPDVSITYLASQRKYKVRVSGIKTNISLMVLGR